MTDSKGRGIPHNASLIRPALYTGRLSRALMHDHEGTNVMKPLTYWERDIKHSLGCSDELARMIYADLSGTHISFSNSSRGQLNRAYHRSAELIADMASAREQARVAQLRKKAAARAFVPTRTARLWRTA